MAGSPVERERTAPVMSNHDDAIQVQCVKPLVEVADVVRERYGISGLLERPIPMRSGASSRPLPTWGRTFRHKSLSRRRDGIESSACGRLSWSEE
jgi:hypothetical protein